MTTLNKDIHNLNVIKYLSSNTRTIGYTEYLTLI